MMLIFDPLGYHKWLLRIIWKILIGGGTTTVDGSSMGVLGMPEAGKTQFYRSLKGEPYREYEATATEDYPSFNFVIKQRVIRVTSGRDIGGSERYIPIYYDKFIEDKDIIVFIFDVKKYLEEPPYQQEVRDRLDYVWRRLLSKFGEDQSIEQITRDIKKQFILFASHFDQLSDQQKKDALGKLHDSVKGKVFGEMFHNNMYIVDLRDRELLFEIFEKTKLFG